MRINHNIASLSAQSSMYRVGRAMGKSIEKLSTGLRINSAADDAAGLGVSERLRTQVRGLGQSLRNTQDAIALLQIADGALEEQAGIMQRMRELVIQAKNQTYTNTERAYMFEEFKALTKELDRIAQVTNYNGLQLFATPEATENLTTRGAFTDEKDLTAEPREIRNQRNLEDVTGTALFGSNDNTSSHHFNMMVGANVSSGDVSSYNTGYEFFSQKGENFVTIQFGQMDANSLLTLTLTRDIGTPAGQAHFWDADSMWDSFNLGYLTDPEDTYIAFGARDDGLVAAPAQATFEHKLNLLQRVIDGGNGEVGTGTVNRIVGAGGSSNTTGLRRISTMRAHIGALINRLEAVVNNSTNQITHQQAAESVLRDVDFASETASLTRNQILTQSSTAMLGQANMMPQSVLSLLG